MNCLPDEKSDSKQDIQTVLLEQLQHLESTCSKMESVISRKEGLARDLLQTLCSGDKKVNEFEFCKDFVPLISIPAALEYVVEPYSSSCGLKLINVWTKVHCQYFIVGVQVQNVSTNVIVSISGSIVAVNSPQPVEHCKSWVVDDSVCDREICTGDQRLRSFRCCREVALLKPSCGVTVIVTCTRPHKPSQLAVILQWARPQCADPLLVFLQPVLEPHKWFFHCVEMCNFPYDEHVQAVKLDLVTDQEEWLARYALQNKCTVAFSSALGTPSMLMSSFSKLPFLLSLEDNVFGFTIDAFKDCLVVTDLCIPELLCTIFAWSENQLFECIYLLKDALKPVKVVLHNPPVADPQVQASVARDVYKRDATGLVKFLMHHVKDARNVRFSPHEGADAVPEYCAVLGSDYRAQRVEMLCHELLLDNLQ